MTTLFHMSHYGGLSQLIYLCDKIGDNHSILITSVVNHQSVKALEENNLFDKVIFVNDYLSRVDSDDLDLQIIDYYNMIFKDNCIDIGAINSIYSICDHQNVFGVYCRLIGKRYVAVELVPNQFSMKWRLSKPAYVSQSFYNLEIKNGVIDCFSEECVIYYSKENKANAINFSTEIFNLKEDTIEKIKKTFKIKNDGQVYDLLILSSKGNTLANTTHYSSDDYLVIYQLLADYYSSNKIMVKNHPMSMDVCEDDFPNCVFVDKDLPIEYLKYSGCTFDKALSIHSSSVEKITSFIKTGVFFSSSFFKKCHQINDYYVISEIAKNNNVCLKIDDEVIYEIMNSFGVDISDCGYEIIDHFDSISSECFFYISDDRDYRFYAYDTAYEVEVECFPMWSSKVKYQKKYIYCNNCKLNEVSDCKLLLYSRSKVCYSIKKLNYSSIDNILDMIISDSAEKSFDVTGSIIDYVLGSGCDLKSIIEIAMSDDNKTKIGSKALIGCAYMGGCGVSKDLIIASNILEEISFIDNIWVNDKLYRIYYEMNKPETDIKMISAILSSIKQGDKTSMIRLSNLFKEGRGVPRDLVKAKEWLEKI